MKPLIVAAALCLALPAVASAQDQGGMDLAAFKAKRVEAFMRMDTDHDGRVSQTEMTAFMAGRKHGGKHGDKAFRKMDVNGDGYLSADEMGRAAEHRFHKIDTNGDGKIVASERAAAHHGRGEQPTGF